MQNICIYHIPGGHHKMKYIKKKTAVICSTLLIFGCVAFANTSQAASQNIPVRDGVTVTVRDDRVTFVNFDYDAAIATIEEAEGYAKFFKFGGVFGALLSKGVGAITQLGAMAHDEYAATLRRKLTSRGVTLVLNDGMPYAISR